MHCFPGAAFLQVGRPRRGLVVKEKAPRAHNFDPVHGQLLLELPVCDAALEPHALGFRGKEVVQMLVEVLWPSENVHDVQLVRSRDLPYPPVHRLS